MKRLKKAYYYLFYKLYRWYENVGSFAFWSDWKAALSLDVIAIFIGISFFTYYMIFIDRYFRLGDGKFLLIGYVLLIAIPNYFIFHSRNQWKDIVKEFDLLPKKKNRIGGWLVTGFVLLVITNMVFGFYLMSQIDWAKYR